MFIGFGTNAQVLSFHKYPFVTSCWDGGCTSVIGQNDFAVKKLTKHSSTFFTRVLETSAHVITSGLKNKKTTIFCQKIVLKIHLLETFPYIHTFSLNIWIEHAFCALDCPATRPGDRQ